MTASEYSPTHLQILKEEAESTSLHNTLKNTTSDVSREFQMPVYRFGRPNYVPKFNENWWKTTSKQHQLFNIFHAHASTCCQTFDLSNTLQNVELCIHSLCMAVSATVACLNTSRHRLYKLFDSTGMPTLTTGYGTDHCTKNEVFH